PLSSLLDIGCGTGLELASIYRKFPNVQITGIDLSKEMMSKLKEKYSDKNIDLILADYFEYPFEQEKYDAALSFETLHHFKYQKKQKIYKKLFQTIKPGGYYVECDYMACCLEEETICL
ncbi:class I SAM-dependent methyltransferase, partial [Clostridioides difficile]|uniref:class I SAM-dependent methyltransferase n=1 Tax=Clostridioides difficile TaxID=1496 RepID=UPI001C67BED4